MQVFAFAGYYPHGGAHDLVGDVETLADAEALLNTLNPDKVQFAHAFNGVSIVRHWKRQPAQGKPYWHNGPWEVWSGE